jgi:formylglycine-generating enzyme required for sulfatase activity
MGSNPSNFNQCGSLCPVENVSWNDAQEFIRRLGAKTGTVFRLPSEAEWEYACRAGGSHQYCGGDNADAVAWYSENSGYTPHPVASKQPNAFGLHDMSGNVFQWVDDWYHTNYIGGPVDGSSWVNGGDQKYRVLRGGAWNSFQVGLRPAYRNRFTSVNRDLDLGFRLAQTLDVH